MSQKLITLVKNKFGDAILDSHSRLGNDTVVIEAKDLIEVASYLRHDPATKMDLLRDLTAVDYLNRIPRFEVVYILYSMEHKHMLTVRVIVHEEQTTVPTTQNIWKISSWMEREVWDMYGIHFEGHPDLRRVLLYEEFDGHPLRKDYATQQSQPRVELLARERDAVEEFKKFHQEKEGVGGSRDLQ